MGDVANREEKDQNEQQPQDFLFQYLVSGICGAENHNHMSIAAQCDEERDKKSSDGPSKAVDQVILKNDLIGGLAAFISHVCFVVDNVWKTLNRHQQPNHG